MGVLDGGALAKERVGLVKVTAGRGALILEFVLFEYQKFGGLQRRWSQFLVVRLRPSGTVKLHQNHQ